MRFAETSILFLPKGPLFGLNPFMWLPLVMICAQIGMKKLNVFRLTLLIALNVRRKLEWNSLIETESIECRNKG
jgi:hypothetical protein